MFLSFHGLWMFCIASALWLWMLRRFETVYSRSNLRALFRKYVANSFQFTVLHCTYHSFHFGILRRNPTYIIYFHVVINSECIIVFLWVLLFHHNWIWFSIVSTFSFSFQTCLKVVPIINRLYLFCSWSWCYFFVFHCCLFCFVLTLF